MGRGIFLMEPQKSLGDTVSREFEDTNAQKSHSEVCLIKMTRKNDLCRNDREHGNNDNTSTATTKKYSLQLL